MPCHIENARQLSSFKGGGDAFVFVPACEEDLLRLLAEFADCGVQPYVLGGGSNTVIAGKMASVPVVSTKNLCSIEKKGGRVCAGAGAKIRDVSKALNECGLLGFEFLAGVPLSVGGAVKMNASAFERETKDCVFSVKIAHFCEKTQGFEIGEFERDNLNFGYRKGPNGIVLSACFAGPECEREKALSLSKECLAKRREKQPSLPSCGSVFKNGKESSGKLIELCGLKGARVGGAMISEKHANFIVNVGGGSGDDFVRLMELAKEKVFQNFGVLLEEEVKVLW